MDAQQVQKWQDSIRACIPEIRNGDLILRTGNDVTSETFRNLMQRNRQYSHCGIASWENNQLYIYHALGGSWNPDQKIRRDPLPFFADPESNRGIGIYRFAGMDSLSGKVLNTARSLFLQGVRFDMDFDLQTKERMYCSEFVWHCLETGSRQVLVFPISKAMNREFMGIDDLFLHPSAKRVKAFRYQ